MSTSLVPPARLLADFTVHYRGLVRFLTRRTGCPEAARELVHDAWLRLAEREAPPASGTEAPPLDTRAYLYTVAAHLASNLHRHKGRSAERFVEGAQADAAAQAAPAGDDVERRHGLRQAVAAVDTALQAMPARRRDIFLEHRLDGAPQAVLAQRHGVSVKTIEREVQASMEDVQDALLRWRGDAALAEASTRRKGRRRALSALLGAAGVGVGAHWIWREQVPQFQLALATGTGQGLQQRLPDGSRLELDAASRAEVALYATRRTARLSSGSAYFDLAPDAERPFSVDAGPLRLLTLAARFAVELAEPAMAAPRLSVTLESGELLVRTTPEGAGAGERRLRAGERLQYEGGRLTVTRPAAEQRTQREAAPWRSGWLDFDGTPLAEVAWRLQRYHRGAIHVAPAAARLSVVGRVRIDLALEWLGLLPASLPVRVRRQGREVFIESAFIERA